MPVRHQVVVAMIPGMFVYIGIAPRVWRYGVLLQVGAIPFCFAGWLGDKCDQALRSGWIVAGVEPVLIQRLAERIDLRPGRFYLGFSDLGEVFWPHVTCEQSDNDHDHEEFQQGKPTAAEAPSGRFFSDNQFVFQNIKLNFSLSTGCRNDDNIAVPCDSFITLRIHSKCASV